MKQLNFYSPSNEKPNSSSDIGAQSHLFDKNNGDSIPMCFFGILGNLITNSDSIRLEVTNYRQERRERRDNCKFGEPYTMC